MVVSAASSPLTPVDTCKEGLKSNAAVTIPSSCDGCESTGEEKTREVKRQRIRRCCKTLTLSTTNPFILPFKAMEYAARGPCIMRAMELEGEMKRGMEKPFKEIIKANLGDAHAMGQKPITFVRQVLALLSCPCLIESGQFNEDVKEKARNILSACRGGSTGSYSDSRGLEIIRKHVAEYIQTRDKGVSANTDDVVLCAGASEGIRACLKLFKDGGNGKEGRSGVMVPVPEYPLYSATLGEYDIHKIPYYLDESNHWGVNLDELEDSFNSSLTLCNPRAVVVINPGNPTGMHEAFWNRQLIMNAHDGRLRHVLTKENIENIIRFAYQKRLFILADEVYQDNVYGDREFLSFKKVLRQMEAPYNEVELISFYSCSKGYVCECGLRGGYFETVNMDSEVKSVLLASVAAKLCPTVLGQAAVDCCVDPPKHNDPSYELFTKEKNDILQKLAERAEMVNNVFEGMPGIQCSKLEGAMYAFPKILIPERAIIAAKEIGQEPDVFYALELLENTGICVVPGSGIGQQPGTYHFRITILASTEATKVMMIKLKEFHINFLTKYAAEE